MIKFISVLNPEARTMNALVVDESQIFMTDKDTKNLILNIFEKREDLFEELGFTKDKNEIEELKEKIKELTDENQELLNKNGELEDELTAALYEDDND